MSDSYYNKSTFQVWNFPTFEGIGDSIEPFEADEHNAINAFDTHDDSPVPAEVDVPEENHEIAEQINYLETLGLQMKKLLSEIDESLLNNIVTLVKKTVKKIVVKEMAVDGNVLKDMIAASLATINRDDGICIIHISEEDKSLFAENAPLQNVVIKTDPALQKGDYVIKSRFSELEAILEQRINTLLGI